MADPRFTNTLPLSSFDRTVFPYDFKTDSFDMSSFSSNPSTSSSEVKQILEEIQVAQQPYIKKESKATTLFFIGITVIITTLVALFFTIGLNNSRAMCYSAAVAAIPLLIMIFVYMKYTENNNKEARQVVQNIMDHHNKTFASRGLCWKMPSQFPQWIELCRNVRTVDGEEYKPPRLHAGGKDIGSKGEFETSLATSAESTV